MTRDKEFNLMIQILSNKENVFEITKMQMEHTCEPKIEFILCYYFPARFPCYRLYLFVERNWEAVYINY